MRSTVVHDTQTTAAAALRSVAILPIESWGDIFAAGHGRARRKIHPKQHTRENRSSTNRKPIRSQTEKAGLVVCEASSGFVVLRTVA
ncbi:unnamed protein product, partial [Amoebophrya sp. A25]|eukprot:GSA25T00006730001.1